MLGVGGGRQIQEHVAPLRMVGTCSDRRLSDGDIRPGELAGAHYHKSITCSGEQHFTPPLTKTPLSNNDPPQVGLTFGALQ